MRIAVNVTTDSDDNWESAATFAREAERHCAGHGHHSARHTLPREPRHDRDGNAVALGRTLPARSWDQRAPGCRGLARCVFLQTDTAHQGDHRDSAAGHLGRASELRRRHLPASPAGWRGPRPQEQRPTRPRARLRCRPGAQELGTHRRACRRVDRRIVHT